MPTKIAQLVIHDPHHSQKAGELLIQPAPESGEADLLTLIEIDSNEPQDYQFIEQFIRTTYQIFESSQLANAERALEQILQKLNQELFNFLPRQRRWLERLHCLVALLSNNHLYFSTFGKIKVYLIKPTIIKEIIGQSEKEENNIFAYTLSGELKADDRILITTDSLSNYLSLEKIKKIVSTLPPKSAVAHFNNILQASSPEVSFHTIILQAGSTKSSTVLKSSIPTKLTTPTTSRNSLDQLLAVEKETEKILTPPSFLQSIKDRVKRKAAHPKTAREKKAAKIPLTKRPSRAVKSKTTQFINPLKKIWPYINSGAKLKEKTNQLFYDSVKHFKKLTKINRFLILALIVLLLLFSQNLIWKSRQQSNIKEEEKLQQLLGEIENKQNGIEASLIYNDTVRAKQLLQEIYEILETMPQNTKERIAKYQQVSEGVQILYERVWRVTNILEPLSLVNFAEINPSSNVYKIALRENRLFGFNNTNQLFTVDLANNQEKLIIDNFNLQLQNSKLNPKINKIVGHTSGKQFYSLAESETEELSVALPSSLQQIDDLTFFLDKMYLLDKASNQVYRLTQTGKGFGSAKPWIKDSSPVNQAVSMAVDGYLYLLLNDGQIQRFASGQKRDFPKITVEPALTSAKAIYTNEETNYLYLLDPANKRFVVLTKEGEVKNQYYSEKFNDLKDFIVSEKDKKVYLLNGSQVYVIAVQ